MELQRSVTSFRRQGSSGLVWDDKFIAGLGCQNQNQETKGNQNQHQNERVEVRGSITTLERSRSTGAQPYRTVNVAPPPKDPPSPKLPTCGFCAPFGTPNPKSKKRR